MVFHLIKSNNIFMLLIFGCYFSIWHANAEVYIDDIGAFSHSWDDHLQLLHIILTKLQGNGFTVNPLKYEWAARETGWLGYWLTPNGLKSLTTIIDAVI